MLKKLLAVFFLIFISLIFVVTFLSYFGLETDRFNQLIKNKVLEVNENVNLEFESTKTHLSIKDLKIVIKLKNPKAMIKNDEIKLEKINLFLSLKSFFSSDFLLKKIDLGLAKNDIKDLIKVTNIALPQQVNKQIETVFIAGSLEGEFIIPFNPDGTVSSEYRFQGNLSEVEVKIAEGISVKGLFAELRHETIAQNYNLYITINKGSLLNLELLKSSINYYSKENLKKIESEIYTKGEINFDEIKKISKFFNLEISPFKNINGKVNLKTNINFDLDNNLKVKNLFYSTEGNIDQLEMELEEKRITATYLPLYKNSINIKETNVEFTNSKSKQSLQLIGHIKIGKDYDSFNLLQNYNFINKIHNISGKIDLTNSSVNIPKINYKKDDDKKSYLEFNIDFILNKYFKIKNLKFLSGKNEIYLTNIKLNNDFEIIKLEKIRVKTFSNKIKNNDFFITRSNKIKISGTTLDLEPTLKTLYKKKNDKNTFSKKFKSELSINIDKIITGTDDNLSNFAMIGQISRGSFVKMSLKGNFSENEIFEMSLYQIDKDKKSLQVISDRALPFVKNFEFIKGFKGGKLFYETVISKEVSNSSLKITDFNVSKVPALAQLLTLADLRGISDTLRGEGIRFDTFEMKSNTKGNVLNIEEAFAIGPAISILLEGYIDKGKVISLRGTLVPATKLNSIVASIPVVGDILVGKKVGEGVVGVSFKMKGPPKNIKTTVNPIKTLTPRFIVRAVEKIKKQKQSKD